MFHYRLDKDMYYIKENKSNREYGAFIWIFCKKRYMWKVEENVELETKYPGSDFCYWFTKGKIMIMGKKGVVETIKR